MASTLTDSIDLRPRQSIEVNHEPQGEANSISEVAQIMDQSNEHHQDGDFSRDNCDTGNDGDDGTIKISSTTKSARQAVAPYLSKHIPQQYAPLGLPPNSSVLPVNQQRQKDPNTKYCYRHRPDLKCRRTADEPSMENLQRVFLLCY
jgi:hypothetical protein